MATDQTPVSAGLLVRRDEEQGFLFVGVEYQGAFLPITAVKLSKADDFVQVARDQAQQQQQQFAAPAPTVPPSPSPSPAATAPGPPGPPEQYPPPTPPPPVAP